MNLDIQKASLLKRISAWLLDSIIVVIIAVGAATLISVATGYDTYETELEQYYQIYEDKYDIKFEIDSETYNAMSESERADWDAAYEELCADKDAIYTYNMVLNLTLVMLTVGVLAGVGISEFVIPLLLKNGQTLGKKVFGIAVMRTNCVRIGGVSLFVRALLGKYTIETMLPVLIVFMWMFNIVGSAGTVFLLLLGLVQVIMLCVTKNNCLIHDMISDSISVDLATQKIFDSEEDLIEYKKRMSAESAMQKPY